MSRVLVVDDEPAMRFALAEMLGDRGHDVVAVDAGAAALDHLGEVDVVVTDLAMPGLDGLGVVREARRRAPGLPVIVLTARGSEKSAVEAMKAGADDYLTKPFDVEEVALAVARAAEAAGLRREVARAAAERATGRALIGDGPAMRALLTRIERIAPRDVTVLVRGETGTGKELAATLLHALGPHAQGPLVRFNCAAIPSELADAELFGHARGAFTGAHEARPGYFVRADGGTLILDEVGELPLAIQAKLLRAVQDGEVQPVGGAPRKVDVRIIACTHRDLREDARAGRFRDDLYFRLAVVELEVPALRARREDIPALARAFAARLAARWAIDVRLGDELVAELARRPWPGNVRELENTIARLVAESDGGELGVDALGRPEPLPAADAPGLPFRARVEAFERALIGEAMTAAGGNRAEAARRLGLSRVTLLDRMKRLGLG
ncbi:MAG: sigma-54-dependent Fis family transcriptional regulator [Deltaproteobacteria bacterium]|nr:MAG: sigma-54-dependent Fis family transcriptional regulator [Deltaproteobacteria bacterium]